MSLLSDKSIIKRMCDGSLVIKPGPSDARRQPTSVDLRLNETVIVKHLGFQLGSTVEHIEIPYDLAAVIDGKSSWGRRGLFVHITAGYIDPGFRGQITLEFFNVSGKEITIEAGATIAQIRFFTLSTPAFRPYGSEGLGSHYQDSVGTIPAADD